MVFEDRRLTVSAPMREYLLKLDEANDRLLRLVDDLVEVSRTESNRLKLDLQPLDPAEAVRQAIAELRPTAVSRGIAIRHSPAGTLPPVLADGIKLHEVMTNLLSNAIKYNVPDGRVDITQETRGQFVLTTVTDGGLGISEEDQKRLFQKFWRSDDLTVRSQPGTGLGLFIVRELVRRMGGEVEIKSKRGEGTAVSFSLPVA